MKASIKPSTLMHWIQIIGFVIFGLWAVDGLAQTPQLPDLNIDGVDTGESDPMALLISIAKVIFRVILWIGVLFLGVKVLIESFKDIRDAKDGDTKWIAAGKSIASGVFFFIVALALALWIQGALLS